MIDGNTFKLTFFYECQRLIKTIVPPAPRELNFHKEYKTSALSSRFEPLHMEG